MKYYLLLLLSALSLSSTSQTNVVKCDCKVFVNWTKVTEKMLTEVSFYRTVQRLDTFKDDGCDAIHTILKDSADYFLILPYSDAREAVPQKKLPAVWLRKAGQFAVNGQCFGKSFYNLYDKADSNSAIVVSTSCEKNKYREMEVYGCQGNWLYVEMKYVGMMYKGWVSKYAVCPLPCTTCN